MNFRPEMGQMCFGNKWDTHSCPDFVEAGLAYLGGEIERVEWNNRQKIFDSPITGGPEIYEKESFTIRPYWWGECDCEEEHKEDCPVLKPNFECENFEVYWYKHFGRSMSISRKIDANEFFELLAVCLKEVRESDNIAKMFKKE